MASSVSWAYLLRFVHEREHLWCGWWVILDNEIICVIFLRDRKKSLTPLCRTSGSKLYIAVQASLFKLNGLLCGGLRTFVGMNPMMNGMLRSFEPFWICSYEQGWSSSITPMDSLVLQHVSPSTDILLPSWHVKFIGINFVFSFPPQHFLIIPVYRIKVRSPSISLTLTFAYMLQPVKDFFEYYVTVWFTKTTTCFCSIT